ncbi:Ada metal-binding domain-containing protein [Catalinimonas niigatensis]|uniref:Ada metal-binding domain-containing protein n=1 Tax=Catalinimonas niigatensis TaxID=1397264 RepID=UPI002664E83E|nr:Ada metal-binding domain-containing protein [Catalinimonas niigatensis]WPP50378.1 Ada metal-binding domain-containing protein [Catalinimonas niigatensis]
MIRHHEIPDLALRRLIKEKKIGWGGNFKLKIYGTLNCKSGKRLKKETRVFFFSDLEAVKEGYRPCGHCLKEAYKNWKNGLV